MIEASFFHAGGCLHARVEGHAGNAPKGLDTVCAGVSSLICALGETVERMYEQGMLKRYPRVLLEEGRADIIAMPKAAFRDQAMMVFWMAEVGVGMIAGWYPECVTVEEAMVVAAQQPVKSEE